VNLLDLVGQAVDPRLRLRELIEQSLKRHAGRHRQGIQLFCQVRDPLSIPSPQ
jgi:hypothetical protein